MPSGKPRITITLSASEKVKLRQIAESLGHKEAALCGHLVRVFLADYDGGDLPKIKIQAEEMERKKLEDWAFVTAQQLVHNTQVVLEEDEMRRLVSALRSAANRAKERLSP